MKLANQKQDSPAQDVMRRGIREGKHLDGEEEGLGVVPSGPE